jgi:hypothetical protein
MGLWWLVEIWESKLTWKIYRMPSVTFGALLPYTVLLVAIGHQLVKLGPTELVIVLLGILLVSAIPVLWRYWPVRSADS